MLDIPIHNLYIRVMKKTSTLTNNFHLEIIRTLLSEKIDNLDLCKTGNKELKESLEKMLDNFNKAREGRLYYV